MASALGQLAGFVSACEACTALALGSPLGAGESRGHLEQRQVKCTEPRRVPGAADAVPSATLNLQHGRTTAQLAPHYSVGQTGVLAVHGSPSGVPGWRRWKGQELGQTGSS